jgi:hypothetical protein
MVPHPAPGINRQRLRVQAWSARGVAGYRKSVGISGVIANG